MAIQIDAAPGQGAPPTFSERKLCELAGIAPAKLRASVARGTFPEPLPDGTWPAGYVGELIAHAASKGTSLRAFIERDALDLAPPHIDTAHKAELLARKLRGYGWDARAHGHKVRVLVALYSTTARTLDELATCEKIAPKYVSIV